ncbi:SIR2 family protein [Candidatus Nitrosotenuis aquarius]|uniref:SIR2 family protein n=1 Tax=Candidatus Nitrosotenuis aquarius TaxID=1846278 RepID=UPI0013C2C239|nr:SIR2 family protein [Candidatus Nitrosotenuis aquarius]
MKIALFLGAGASVPYGKPTTSQLRNNLIDKFGNQPGRSYLQTLLACDIFEDVEHILQTMKDLTIFQKQLGGQFLQWLGEKGRLIIGLDRGNQGYNDLVGDLGDIKLTLEKEVFENYSWDKDQSDNAAYQILHPILELLKTKSEKIIVFTTNYDRAVEEFCSRDDNNYFCVDGFKLHEDSGRFRWNGGDYSYADAITNKTKVYLYKIHGSLNWKKHKNYGIERTTYERKPEDPNYEEDFLIYPTLSPKEEANGKEPYNSILNKFDELMKSIDMCVVIGFSFRDEHINEKFKEFVDRGGIFAAISPSSQYDFRTRILSHKPTKEEQQVWKNSPYARLTGTGGKDDTNWNITFLQKKLETGSVKGIIHDIQRILEPQKHPL